MKATKEQSTPHLRSRSLLQVYQVSSQYLFGTQREMCATSKREMKEMPAYLMNKSTMYT